MTQKAMMSLDPVGMTFLSTTEKFSDLSQMPKYPLAWHDMP